MNDTTNLLPLSVTNNTERHNEVKKYLMLPLATIVRLLVKEKDAKKRAYRFIEKKGMAREFEALGY